ncbi:MAG: carbamoyltransferase [Bacteroidales bacterium]|nr:carbamoyltransferase [Bacteroidales bacterium]
MTVLGISAFYHDSAAALVVDGIVVAAIQEERLSRIKHDNSFPILACRWCLDFANLRIDDVDNIVFYEKPFLKFERIIESSIYYAPYSFNFFQKAMPVWLGGKLNMRHLISKNLKKEFKCKSLPRISFIEHHKAHASIAYYTSQMPDTAILVIDAVGEKATTSIFSALQGKIKSIKEQQFPNSLGLLYSSATQFLGFKVNSDEYKVMGLAPYGDVNSDETHEYIRIIKEELVKINDDGSVVVNPIHFTYPYGLKMIKIQHWESLFKLKSREYNQEPTQSHKNFAFAFQFVLEDIACRLAETTKQETLHSHLCISGGCAMNCVMNGKLDKLHLFEHVFVPYAPDDSGCAIGAALAVEGKQTASNSAPYLGPSFSDDYIKSFIQQKNISYEYVKTDSELCKLVAQNIANGCIVGWFQGRMEFGARALGNRSILADARDPYMKDKINKCVKFREPFRPFAPVVLEEYASSYFDMAHSPYMMFTCNVLKHTVPAITHVDNSSRIQTVSKEQNPLLHELLCQYMSITAVPAILNTSFNIMGEPIVCSPEDALITFNNSGIDLLVIGHYIITKKV